MKSDWPIRATGAPLATAMTPLEAAELARVLPELAREHGRVGAYFSYEVGRAFESLPAAARDDLQLPLAVAFSLDTNPTRSRIDTRVDRHKSAGDITSTFTRTEFVRAVERCLDYIRAGDIFQVNLAQRLLAPTNRSADEIFDHLLTHAPAPYAALIQLDDAAIVSNSPELFFRIDPLPGARRRIVNRPIKGTRPNQPGMSRELELSEKDQAELAMIVDLQRNDLGRICEIGSVRVTQPRVIETHPTVIHGVATVEGILRSEVTFDEILRAIFPCGSITGCPKIRAMEIIDELEPVARGPYCGAIGWIDADGAAEFSVAIRTMVLKNGIAHIPVGGGIVADSSPEAEYEETLVKARALLEAVGCGTRSGLNAESEDRLRE